jgi:hypothetical protein
MPTPFEDVQALAQATYPTQVGTWNEDVLAALRIHFGDATLDMPGALTACEGLPNLLANPISFIP